MTDITKIPLTSSEIAGLHSSYISDSMAVCVLSYFLNRTEDNDVRPALQHALDLSNQHIQKLTSLMNQEKLSIPDGFKDNDVDINAPRLFTDIFYLKYLSYIARVGMHNYTLVLNQIARSDIRDYFSKSIIESVDLYNMLAEIQLSKGVFFRAPRVEVPREIQYIKSESFITDWFGEKRPLLLIEITHIFANIIGNLVGSALATGFGQVAKTKQVRDYMFKGKGIATEQISTFTAVFNDEAIPTPSSPDSFVTDSTSSPFSEKLMMFHMVAMNSSGITSLGMSIAATLRSDLQAKYLKFTAEILKYAREGADLMISNKWFEQPPQAIKHENLVKSK